MPAAKGNKYNQKGDEPMTDHLHCRISPKLKARFKVEAKKVGLTLCEWVMKTLSDKLGE